MGPYESGLIRVLISIPTSFSFHWCCCFIGPVPLPSVFKPRLHVDMLNQGYSMSTKCAALLVMGNEVYASRTGRWTMTQIPTKVNKT